jgi:hypothetical protein
MENLAVKMRFLANVSNDNCLTEFTDFISVIEGAAKEGHFEIEVLEHEISSSVIQRLKMVGFQIWNDEGLVVIQW